MNELEVWASQEKLPLGIDNVPRILKRIKNHWEVEKLRPELKNVARHIAEGEASLLPGQGVYVVLLNGKNAETVERLRTAKGRRPEQREATVLPPEKLFGLIDFPLLKEFNPRITREIIADLYKTHPCGLILPCLEEVVPNHLITYHEVEGRQVPTIMNTWVARYRLYDILWGEISRYPDVLLAGTSANCSGVRSPLTFDEAYPYLSKFVAIAIKDPGESDHFYKGSHTIFNLLKDPVEVVREGSVHPEKHPKEFQKFMRVFQQA